MQAGAKLTSLFKSISNSVLYSYTQIFFSRNYFFGVLLLLASFFDPLTGSSGLYAVAITNIAAYFIGFPVLSIASGIYGFNSLLVGLGLGSFFSFSPVYILVLTFAALLTLMCTVWLNGFFAKYNLPSLSLPFLFALWMLLLALKQFEAMQLSERGIYWMNEVYYWGGAPLVDFYSSLEAMSLPMWFKVYLKSLSAIFFQYNILVGFLIMLGLLISSRIAFCLSLLGFLSAYVFYNIVGANLLDLQYHYIGFNFILTAIAVGGFFFVPSVYSYLWVFLLVPVITIISSSASIFLSTYGLPIYSLPFNLTVIVFVYVMMFRLVHKGLKPVLVQHFQPEKNLYQFINSSTRYKNAAYIHLQLPFWGKWMVSQGYDGKITHLGDWSKALDFIILDEEMKPFAGSGKYMNDFYCFNKPVLAPADGTIVDVVDYVEDNLIGNMDIARNWGNALVIKHAEGLYSKLSHLKQHSIKVKKGDWVKKGDLIASCGSSGRSPEPHLHFQTQATPYIGSKTLAYPFSYFVVEDKGSARLESFTQPKEGQFVSPVEINPLLQSALNFVPGKKITWRNESSGVEEAWEVFTNAYNQTYIYCTNTQSYAYFVNDGTVFYFTTFEGDKKSFLYYFYLGFYKVLLGYYDQMQLTDEYPTDLIKGGLIQPLQDMFAPFYRFVSTRYEFKFSHIDSEHATTEIEFNSKAITKAFANTIRKNEFKCLFKNGQIQSFTVQTKNNSFTIKCAD